MRSRGEDLDIGDLAYCGASPVAIVFLRSRIHNLHPSNRTLECSFSFSCSIFCTRMTKDRHWFESTFCKHASTPERHPSSYPLLPIQTRPSTLLRTLDFGKDPTCPAPAITRQTGQYTVATHATNPDPRNVNFVRQPEVYPRTSHEVSMKEMAKEGMKDLLAAENVYAYTQWALRKKCLSGLCSRPDFEALVGAHTQEPTFSRAPRGQASEGRPATGWNDKASRIPRKSGSREASSANTTSL